MLVLSPGFHRDLFFSPWVCVTSTEPWTSTWVQGDTQVTIPLLMSPHLPSRTSSQVPRCGPQITPRGEPFVPLVQRISPLSSGESNDKPKIGFISVL